MRVAVMVTVLALGAAACGGDGSAEPLPATPLPAEEDPGMAHVHGLGVNPADDLVYVATHFGLWRLGESGPPERVGDAFHDLMGFAVVGPDHFQASGHPLMLDDLPPLLGLIESTDGGITWTSSSLMGEADFHALRNAHDRVYGWNSTDGAFMVSDDGLEWDVWTTAPMADFVVDPDDPEAVLASVSESFDAARLVHSTDGGRSWSEVEGPMLARLAWETAERLWGVGFDGGVWHSADSGETWEQVGAVPGRPEAFLDTGDDLIVAIEGGIWVSEDSGATWSEHQAP